MDLIPQRMGSERLVSGQAHEAHGGSRSDASRIACNSLEVIRPLRLFSNINHPHRHIVAIWFGKEGIVSWDQTITPWLKEEGRE